MSHKDREPTIVVVLSCDGTRIDEKTVEFLGIEEDIQGADILTFKCPRCGEQHKSRRYG